VLLFLSDYTIYWYGLALNILANKIDKSKIYTNLSLYSSVIVYRTNNETTATAASANNVSDRQSWVCLYSEQLFNITAHIISW